MSEQKAKTSDTAQNSDSRVLEPIAARFVGSGLAMHWGLEWDAKSGTWLGPPNLELAIRKYLCNLHIFMEINRRRKVEYRAKYMGRKHFFAS